MNKFACIFFLIAIPALTGCYRQVYFLSPLNANTNFYHAIPLRSDTIKSATYLSGTVSIGGANDYYEDQVFSFNGYFHRSHAFNSIQAYYGANFSLGSYNVGQSYYYNPYTTPLVNYDYGRKFFGSVGVSGGMNLVIPMGSRHEWRVIGIETTLQKEYGSYLSFRKSLPDSAATAITRNNLFISGGLTTEFVFKIRRRGTIGYKLAIGSSFQKTPKFYYYYGNNGDHYYQSVSPFYISNTLQITRNKVTGFIQINGGEYAANFQTGISYKLGGKRK